MGLARWVTLKSFPKIRECQAQWLWPCWLCCVCPLGQWGAAHCAVRFPCPTESDPVSHSRAQQPARIRETSCRIFLNIVDSIPSFLRIRYDAPPNSWNDLVIPKM